MTSVGVDAGRGAGATADRYEVVVVGGGPVGHALAIELGRRGVRCALVERREAPQPIPKGQNLTQRTMEHFARWGCEGQLRERRPVPKGYPIGGIVAYRDLMSDYWHAPAGREAVGAYFSQANERLPQYETEAVLRERAGDDESVATFYGYVATSIDRSEHAVRVSVTQEGSSDAQTVLEADYVVGCDGAHSLVREQAGIDRASGALRQRMVLAVFRSTELHEALSRFPERTTYRAMHPDLGGYWRFFGRVDAERTWFFHAPVEDGTGEQDVVKLLHESAGVPFSCDFSYLGFWDLRVDVARTYRRGRVLIAGDAAHSHPPYGGYGLNTGLEDAVNLGWKLAAVLRGWGGDGLLDSYSLERQPVFEETGRDVITAGIERDRALLERFDPSRDRVAFEEAWAQMAVADTGPQWYEPHYEGSPVVDGPAGGRCGVLGEHRLDARPGHHLGPCRLSDGRNAFDALGDGFTLLVLGASGVADGFEEAAGRLGVPLTVLVSPTDAARSRYGSTLVLVRPDQYVAWIGGDAPFDARAVLQAAAGAAPLGFQRGEPSRKPSTSASVSSIRST